MSLVPARATYCIILLDKVSESSEDFSVLMAMDNKHLLERSGKTRPQSISNAAMKLNQLKGNQRRICLWPNCSARGCGLAMRGRVEW